MNKQLTLFMGGKVCCASVMIIVATYVPLLQHHGLTLPQIGWLEGIFVLMAVALDIPTGRFADLVGRRKCVVLGRLASAVGFALYATSSTFSEFLFAEIFLAFGLVCVSGAEDAYLQLIVSHQNGTHERFLKLRGIGIAVELGSGSLAAMAGPFAASIHGHLPFVVASVSMVFASVCAACMEEPPFKRQTTLGMVETTLGCLKHDRVLRGFIAFDAAVCFIIGAPFFLYVPLLKAAQVPTWYHGLFYATTCVIAGCSSLVAPRLWGGFKLGQRQVLVASVAVAALVLAALLPPQIGLLCILMHQVVRGSLPLLLIVPFLARLSEGQRATALSVRNMIVRLGDGSGKWFALQMAGASSIHQCFGAAAAAGTLLLLAAFRLSRNGSGPEFGELAKATSPAAVRAESR